MRICSFAMIAALAAILCGCATLLQGHQQNISVLTTPEGAQCDLVRKATHLASVAATPKVVTVTRTKNDIIVICRLAGYRPASQRLHSGVSGVAIGDALIGAIGWGIDSAEGTDNEYPYAVNLMMTPVSGSAPGG